MTAVAFMERILVILQGTAAANKPWLPLDDKASYVVHCRPASNSETSKLYNLSFTGAFDMANIGFAKQLDQMVWELWTPGIEAKNNDKPSVPLACLCIGYLHLLFRVRLVDESKSPYNQHNFLVLLTQTSLIRLDALIISVTKSVRDGRREIDSESRPGLVLLYLYLSDLCNLLQHSDDCTMFVSFSKFPSHIPTLTSDLERPGALQLRQTMVQLFRRRARGAFENRLQEQSALA
jgi:hypothetical protein